MDIRTKNSIKTILENNDYLLRDYDTIRKVRLELQVYEKDKEPAYCISAFKDNSVVGYKIIDFEEQNGFVSMEYHGISNAILSLDLQLSVDERRAFEDYVFSVMTELDALVSSPTEIKDYDADIFKDKLLRQYCIQSSSEYSKEELRDWESLYHLPNVDDGTIPDHTRYFFDMDGVLAVFQQIKTDIPLDEFLGNKENHYYRTLPPQQNVVDLVNYLIEAGEDVYILSNSFFDVIEDKIDWLKEMCPNLNPNNIYITPYSSGTPIQKADFVEGLNEKDILIDDYNKNLYDWEKMGGTAVKLVNNINSINEDFNYIHHTDSKEVLYSNLKGIEYEIGESKDDVFEERE